jgi:hypothetical protein
VLVVEDQAYWVASNIFYVANVEDGAPVPESAKPVDTTNMSKKDVEKMVTGNKDLEFVSKYMKDGAEALKSWDRQRMEGEEQEGGAEGIFTCQTSNQYGTSLMERLPSVDFEREVRITAYVKETESKKRYTTFITQGEDRVESHFKQWNDEDKKFDIKNGYPEVNEKEQKKFGSDYWTKRYYPEAEVFLIEYIEEHVAPKVNNMVEVVTPKETINPEDIEF